MEIEPSFSSRMKRLITETINRIPSDCLSEIMNNRSFIGIRRRDGSKEQFERNHEDDVFGTAGFDGKVTAIFLNQKLLDSKSAKFVRGVIAHEFAHIYKNHPKDKDAEEYYASALYHWKVEQEAEDLVYEWGFACPDYPVTYSQDNPQTETNWKEVERYKKSPKQE